ncbi:MAG: hypothetical protein IJ809_01710 [Clostridia bacterium]|nr:hypothetical protein [Clostridia bacterium]
MNKGSTRVKNKIFLAIICALLVGIVGTTYSRYTSSATAVASANMAKWNIELNGENISSESKNFNVTAVKKTGVSNNNVVDGKIAPGQTLVASVEVDPTGSEVAVDYLINVGQIQTQGFDTDSEISLSKVVCTVDGVTSEAVKTGDGYIFYEDLTNVLAGNKALVEAYVEWTDSDNAADTANGNAALSIVVPMQVTVRQHLASDGIATYSDSSKTLMVMSSEIQENGTLVLNEDITYDDYEEYPTSSGNVVSFEDNAVFDLSGNTVTAPNGALHYTGNNLTIENGSFNGLISSASGRYGIHLWNDEGSSVSTGVVVQNVSTTGINLYNTEVTLKNVTVTMPDDAKFYTVYGNVYSTITIESGTYTAGNNTTALFGYAGTDSTEVGNATADGKNPVDGFKIYGGTFNTNGKPFCLTSSGHIPPVIYGGTFDCDVTAYVAEGHNITKVDDTTWVVE